jgi:putative oxidoreductase
VGETSTFLLLTAVATLAISGLLLCNRSVVRARSCARGFYFLSVALSLAALALVLAGTFGLPESPGYVRLLRVLLFRGWIVIGVGLSAALLLTLRSIPASRKIINEAARTFISSDYVLKGICLSVSISFFATEIGKLAHDAEMRQFFLQSGYAVWFMYFIMAAEIAGAIGLFLSGMRLPAAVGLMAVMSGAISTHARNHDPLSDSLEALHLLILLGCIVAIGLLRPTSVVFRAARTDGSSA